ncbi:hypothetical protein C0J52_09785 [Blattella germanica]|nr:hypothetical protein C0J52_09785 [Blattella germanica]
MHSRACQMSSGKPALTKDSRNVYQAGEEKRMWIKIQCARGRTAKQCHQGLQEACVAAALLFRAVARWVAAFRDGREHVKHMPSSGHTPIGNENVQIVSVLVEVDRNAMLHQLEQDTRLVHSTALHILKDLLTLLVCTCSVMKERSSYGVT